MEQTIPSSAGGRLEGQVGGLPERSGTQLVPHVSGHAIQRFQERVANVSAEIATLCLSSPTIRKAIEFGAGTVILGTGHIVVIKGSTIVTVKPGRKKRRG